MNRERIKIKDYEEHSMMEEWEVLELVEEVTTYIDLGKGYSDTEVVVKRVSDGKFFKFEYRTSSDDDNIMEQEAEEVFPKTVNYVIYE